MNIVFSILAQLEAMPSGITQPTQFDWWEGLLYFSGLSVVGLIVKIGEKWLERGNTRGMAGGSLKKQIGELKELLEDGDLTQQEFNVQKQAILTRKTTRQDA